MTTIPIVERLRAWSDDPECPCREAADLIEALTPPAEGVETTAEERAKMRDWAAKWSKGVSFSTEIVIRLLNDADKADRQAAHIVTLNAAVARLTDERDRVSNLNVALGTQLESALETIERVRTAGKAIINIGGEAARELADERDLLAAALTAKDAADESGWVIEGAWSDTSAPSYWCGSSAWSEDHMRALRFAREDDARQAAFFMLDGMNIRIAEHGWSKS